MINGFNLKANLKGVIFVIFLIASAAPVFSQSAAQPWWLYLEYGKQHFRNGQYGSALMYFEDARRLRRNMYEQMERDLVNFLSQSDVRRIGDSLDRVEQYSYERLYTSASAVFEELFYRVPRASLNNSASSALQAVGRLKDYPEAEYWIGEVFLVEGELPLALSQFRKALSMRDLMEDPGFALTLQYKISDILRIRQEYNDMERMLLSIINEYDTLWIEAGNANSAPGGQSLPYSQASASFATRAMERTLENEGIVRFMEMYRYNNTTAEQAHRMLGFYYAVSGRPSAQQHLMYAFLIQNTVIIDEIRQKQFDFVFTDFSALEREINRNHLLLSYIEEVEYYKTAYYLGASLYRAGKNTAARSIWEFLAGQANAGEWQGRALNQLRNPQIDPIVEMP